MINPATGRLTMMTPMPATRAMATKIRLI